MEQSKKKPRLELTFDKMVSAVLYGRLDIIKDYLRRNPQDINRPLQEETLLIMACKLRRADIVEFLISEGAYLNQKDSLGNTALHITILMTGIIPRCDTGIEDVPSSVIFKMLVDAGADTNVTNSKGKDPFTIAAKKAIATDASKKSLNEYLEIMEILINKLNLAVESNDNGFTTDTNDIHYENNLNFKNDISKFNEELHNYSRNACNLTKNSDKKEKQKVADDLLEVSLNSLKLAKKLMVGRSSVSKMSSVVSEIAGMLSTLANNCECDSAYEMSRFEDLASLLNENAVGIKASIASPKSEKVEIRQQILFTKNLKSSSEISDDDSVLSNEIESLSDDDCKSSIKNK